MQPKKKRLPPTIDFRTIRSDWYTNGNFIARTIQRQLVSPSPIVLFKRFPRHWLPLFEWAGARWTDSTEPTHYVPLFSGRSESQIVRDIERARKEGQLRYLVEVAASCEVVLSETLQRIEDKRASGEATRASCARICLTTWHSYSRRELLDLSAQLAAFRQTKPNVVFIPCAKRRPYEQSPSHRNLLQKLSESKIDVSVCDKIVVTSIGFLPEYLWNENVVQRYDTGIRDLYRLLVQGRHLLRTTKYREAWDCMSFAPYSDLLRVLHLEGFIPQPQRAPDIRRRNIPVFRMRRRSLL